MTGSACRRCGTELRAGARFCDACAFPVAGVESQAEHKQITVLFADVVRSMDLAASLGAERLREVMADLFNRCGAVIQRYGGTLEKFTGDGVMALFGAPIALEDHAIRACVAALGLQEEAAKLAEDVQRRDAVTLQLRVGLNSGDVVVGELSSDPSSYTAIGEQVGMGQRMESVAPPGGVMLSEATARLIEHAAVLEPPTMVTIKHAPAPVPAHRLIAMATPGRASARREATLVGRDAQMRSFSDFLKRSLDGRGCIVGVSGPAGIGKSRICREVASVAQHQGAAVFSTYCESHTSQFAFTAVARLVRDRLQIAELDAAAARIAVRAQLGTAEPEDLLLLDDLVGIRDPAVQSQEMSADARRRRLTDLAKSLALERDRPAMYIIEDCHWIDEASESMLAEVMAVIPQTRSMVLITYRPEYEGALTKSPEFQSYYLTPLDRAQASELTAELIGLDPSLTELAARITDSSAGNPFYVQEIVREYAERQVLVGDRGAYRRQREVVDVSVPPTLQATIGARIDRLTSPAKRLLNAAAVIGTRFDTELLATVLNESVVFVHTALPELVHSELIDQVVFTPRNEYVFRHQLVQAVAYESQLQPVRAQVHRRLAAAVERRNESGTDEHAAVVAAHLEAAGDLREAFGWHMRAGAWFTNRDIDAARASWQRAQRLADQLPADELGRVQMRVAPRALLCGSAWRAGGSVTDDDIAELRDLCVDPGTRVPLALGLAGMLMKLNTHGHIADASQQSAEYVELIESIGEPTLSVGLLYPAIYAKHEAGHMNEVLRLTQIVIDLADGDPTMGNLLTGSPLAFATTMRGLAKCALGHGDWKNDFDLALTLAEVDETTWVSIVMFKYLSGISQGALIADRFALDETRKSFEIAKRCSEDFALHTAQVGYGLVLVSAEDADTTMGFELLAEGRAAALSGRFIMTTVPAIDLKTVEVKARTGQLDEAIYSSERMIAEQLEAGVMLYLGPTTGMLVESLLRRRGPDDLDSAHAAFDRLASIPTEVGFVLYELPLRRMRAMLAQARGDEQGYRTFARAYLELAQSVGFDGQLAIARTM